MNVERNTALERFAESL